MLMVIPFSECFARPSNGDKVFFLKDHLENVAYDWGKKGASHRENLFFLGGLCHDIGKAQLDWQRWARGDKNAKKPDHASVGSFTFIYIATNYIIAEGLDNREYATLVISIANDIKCHHIELKDLEGNNPPWRLTNPEKKSLNSIDFDGFANFIYERFPVLEGKLDFKQRNMELCGQLFQQRLRTRENIVRHKEAAEKALRVDISSFIYADRFDASGFEQILPATYDDFEKARLNLEKCCQKKKNDHENMSALRQEAQDTVLKNYIKNVDGRIFTLFLPTGYGKTIAALKVALNACSRGKTNRIIYVAPYLSILSQATEEIEKLTSIEVLQQHHLSTTDEGIDERKLFILDTWQAPIVTTTLNQLFRTVFPTRAQHTLRLKSLENSFIIIDEPQIISPKVWNAFLLMVDVLTEKLKAKALFITATMPPTKYGLLTNPIRLEPENINWLSRYQVILEKDMLWDEEKLCSEIIKELSHSNYIAVVVNTIKDCVIVYSLLKVKLKGQRVKIINLHGLMLPGHKAEIIENVKSLTENCNEKLILVSTQIIEAGVDLSFDTIFRALPITPSVGQTAGRVNRHNDRRQGKIIVFDFRRSGKEDTRTYIYRDENSRKVTDEWFYSGGSQSEQELYRQIKAYYEKNFAYNDHRTSLQNILDAANGKWSSFKKLQLPFDDNYEKYAVFVPKQNYIDKKSQKLMEYFKIHTLQELYRYYKDKNWMKDIDFLSAKRFMGLLSKFTVNLDEKIFNHLKTAGKIQEDPVISLLTDTGSYCDETGFGEGKF